MMVNKWRIFKKPSKLKLSYICSVVECCMRLHNFYIDRRETDWKVNDLTPDLKMEHIGLYEEYLDEVDPVDPTLPGCMFPSVEEEIMEEKPSPDSWLSMV